MVSAITLNGLPVAIDLAYLINQDLLKTDFTITLPETRQMSATHYANEVRIVLQKRNPAILVPKY
jgi:hypothetical protein